ncbi:33885_t:CDS:1, partial [Gigaspora margarita]
MNQKSIFLFILLISLSVTNAIPLEKREPQFDDCSGGNFANAQFINVAMSPDPLVSNQSVTFTVSGTLDHDIKDNGLIIAQLDDKNGINIVHFPDHATPTNAGQPFNMKTLPHTLPVIPANYFLTVFIVNPTPQHNDSTDVI